jgi:S-adenosylmethionine hydrolase
LERSGIITLLTDFDERDAYVGTMKGVVLGICPDARIVDISHRVTRHHIQQGAFLLAQAAPYFPDGTIHVAVVDPGVGTARRRLAIQGRRAYYVGPDNGILHVAAQAEGIVKVVEITASRFLRFDGGTTFDGRDVFAPTAAHLAQGVRLEEFGPETQVVTRLHRAEAHATHGTIRGEVLHIDAFGNVITNIPRAMLVDATLNPPMQVHVTLGERTATLRYCRSYGEVAVHAPLVVVGSSGYLEIAVNQGSAEARFSAAVAQPVEITRASKQQCSWEAK